MQEKFACYEQVTRDAHDKGTQTGGITCLLGLARVWEREWEATLNLNLKGLTVLVVEVESTNRLSSVPFCALLRLQVKLT